MNNLSKQAVAVDVELFDLIAAVYATKTYSNKLIKRFVKFVLNNDHISGCFLIQVSPGAVISKIIDQDKKDVFLNYVVKFIKVHSVNKIDAMLKARYADELRRVELRVPSDAYTRILRILEI